jgi:hypothetical protein
MAARGEVGLDEAIAILIKLLQAGRAGSYGYDLWNVEKSRVSGCQNNRSSGKGHWSRYRNNEASPHRNWCTTDDDAY